LTPGSITFSQCQNAHFRHIHHHRREWIFNSQHSSSPIHANKVVFATNGYTTGIAPECGKKIVPVKISCPHISIPKDIPNPPPHLTHTDGGVVCRGAKYTYLEVEKLWFNNCDDSTLLNPVRTHVESVMQKNSRGWQMTGAAIAYLWTGSKLFTSSSTSS
jgi:hypothetical protein